MEALKKVKVSECVENKDMAEISRLMCRYEVKARRKINDMTVPIDEGNRIIGRLYGFYGEMEKYIRGEKV